jgi:hypothetical protein
VAAGEDSGDDQLDDFPLSEEDLVETLVEGAQVLRRIGDFGFRGVIHVRRFQKSGGKRKDGGGKSTDVYFH